MKNWYTIPFLGANGAGRGQRLEGAPTDPEHIAGNKFLAPHVKNADDCVRLRCTIPCLCLAMCVAATGGETDGKGIEGTVNRPEDCR